MKIGRLALRTVVGGLFVGHGTQKLFGWFDGHGLDATAQGFDAMGLKPGKTNAIIAGAGEAAGGAALAAGYQTPLAAAPIIGSMLMAIKHVHAKNGPWSHKGGYEYNLVLIAAVLAIVESGPGPISLDALRGKEKQGLAWALLALGLGAGGVAAVEKLAAGKAQSAVAPEEPAPAPTPAPSATEHVPAAEHPAATEAPVEPAAVEESAAANEPSGAADVDEVDIADVVAHDADAHDDGDDEESDQSEGDEGSGD